MQESQIEQLIKAVDGTIVPFPIEGSGAAGPKLDQGTHDDQGRVFVSSKTLSNQEKLLNHPTDYLELFSETEPSGPHHMVVLTDMHGEFECVTVAKDESTPKPKKGKKVNRGHKEMTPENRDRSMRRAKKTIRQASMMMKADKLGTLTTALPIMDIDEFKTLVSVFLKEVRIQYKKSGGKFQYIVTYEKHDSEKTSIEKRGSFHAHMALSGFVSYPLIHACWNRANARIYGPEYAKSCNFHAQDRISKINKNSRKAFIASYMSKYIAKSFEDVEVNKKRYWKSNNIEKPIKRILYLPRGNGVQYIVFRMLEQVSGKHILRQFDSDQIAEPTGPPWHWYSTY